MNDRAKKNTEVTGKKGGDVSSSSDDEIDSDEDEDLILEGVLVRNPEVVSSEDEDESDDGLVEDSTQEPKKKRAKVYRKHEDMKVVKNKAHTK